VRARVAGPKNRHTEVTMGTIPSSFLPPRALWPQRIYSLPEHAGYPARLNSTEELINRHVEAGHGDRVAVLYEDQRITYRQLQGSVSRRGTALRGLGIEEEDRVLLRTPPAGLGTGKLLRRVLREQAARS